LEKIKIDVYDLEKTDIILNLLWLVAHNWETGENKDIKANVMFSSLA